MGKGGFRVNLMNWGVSMTFRFPNRCKHCREKFTTEELARRLRLHISCIDGYAEAQAEKAKRADAKAARMAAKVERASIRARDFTIKLARAFITWLEAFGAEHGVVFKAWGGEDAY